MVFSIALDRPLDEELRTIALELVERAQHDLDHAANDLHDAVHEVRKHGKKLRALLRLVRTAAPTLHRRENAVIRDVARELSQLRDRGALLETITTLEREAASDEEHQALRALRPRLEHAAVAAHDDAPDVIERARVVFAELHRRVPDWPLGEVEPHDLLAGATRTYRSGRKALAQVQAHDDDRHHHAWRKQVKYGAHHWLLLQQLWPTVIRELHAEADRLADQLGDHHDLAVLADALEALALAPEQEATLRTIIARRREALHAAAIALGERLYVESPRSHRRYLAALHGVAAHAK